MIEEESRIYGDGVNIAARLEALADPGGICISKTAFDQIESKLPLGYKYLGEQTVKNIAKPVGAYKVLMEPRVIDGEQKEVTKTGWPDKPSLPLPDKPSVAVLLFINMSDDPDQEYFTDGISEDIITSLPQLPRIFVIARKSTFTYKGKSADVQQVSRELGVKYILEGSVRKVGNRVRITAQLIDALSGRHIWSEHSSRADSHPRTSGARWDCPGHPGKKQALSIHWQAFKENRLGGLGETRIPLRQTFCPCVQAAQVRFS